MQLNWKIAVFSAFFFGVFVWLGFWQWERAGEKEMLIRANEIRDSQPPVSLPEAMAAAGPVDGMRVRLTGAFIPENVFLLDNRVLSGKVGFEVLVPFRDRSGQLVIVNRGFVPMGRTRSDMPEIPPLGRGESVVGSIYASADERQAALPFQMLGDVAIIQAFVPGSLAERLGETIYGHVIRLDEAAPGALPRFWPVSVMSPERHVGYAVQWFLMALAVLIAFGAVTFRKSANEEVPHDGA